jgi:hypothetical protein
VPTTCISQQTTINSTPYSTNCFSITLQSYLLVTFSLISLAGTSHHLKQSYCYSVPSSRIKHSSLFYNRLKKRTESGATPRKTQNKPNSNFFFSASIHVTGCQQTQVGTCHLFSNAADIVVGQAWPLLTPLDDVSFITAKQPLHRVQKRNTASKAPWSFPIFFPLLASSQSLASTFFSTANVAPCPTHSSSPPLSSLLLAPLCQLH